VLAPRRRTNTEAMTSTPVTIPSTKLSFSRSLYHP
jgi:hypothetical protein